MNTRFSTLVAIIAAVSLASAGTAFAQGQKQGGPGGKRDWRGGPPSVEDKLAFISERLDLTDAQAVEMLELMQIQEQERQELVDAHMAAMAPEFCAMKSAHEMAVLDILDDTQEAEFEAMKEKGKARMGSRRGNRGMDGIDCSTIDY